jgi:hypothetical protein
MIRAIFWANFSHTHLVTLVIAHNLQRLSTYATTRRSATNPWSSWCLSTSSLALLVAALDSFWDSLAWMPYYRSCNRSELSGNDFTRFLPRQENENECVCLNTYILTFTFNCVEPGTDVMIFKMFSPKNLAKNCLFWLKTKLKFEKTDHNIGV